MLSCCLVCMYLLIDRFASDKLYLWIYSMKVCSEWCNDHAVTFYDWVTDLRIIIVQMCNLFSSVFYCLEMANSTFCVLQVEGSSGTTEKVKKGLSDFLGVISDTFAPSPDKTIDCDVITLMATPSGTTELYDSTKVYIIVFFCSKHEQYYHFFNIFSFFPFSGTFIQFAVWSSNILQWTWW